MAKHFAIVKDSNDQPSQFPLKTFLRQNSSLLPNVDPDVKTTGHIRRQLVKLGWRKESDGNQVFLIQPDDKGDYEYAIALIDSVIDEDDDNEESDDQSEITFGLEKDLQSALRRNITSLGSDLTIIDGGSERTTGAGRIDITAKDKNDTVVVIELKAGMAKKGVVEQTLSYISSLKREGVKAVRGIIVASSFHDRIRDAAEAIDNIQLVEYSFQFNFKAV
ncbi:MAG: DUF91 domain-containing protein [Proteobacteria bacterium]|nr:MAG: DUF91 domain-containing protein [Pseudomonadota bacterium]